MDALVRDQSSGLVDTGAGDMAVGKLIEEIPTLIPDLAAVGVEIVLAYMFSPRLSDLSEFATLEAAGFQLAATALILNEGFHAQTLENFDPMGLSDLPAKGPPVRLSRSR